MAPDPTLSLLLEPERGCVVLDQPQRAASSRRLRTSHALRLVFDTAALRSNGAGRGIQGTAIELRNRTGDAARNSPSPPHKGRRGSGRGGPFLFGFPSPHSFLAGRGRRPQEA